MSTRLYIGLRLAARLLVVHGSDGDGVGGRVRWTVRWVGGVDSLLGVWTRGWEGRGGESRWWNAGHMLDAVDQGDGKAVLGGSQCGLGNIRSTERWDDDGVELEM